MNSSKKKHLEANGWEVGTTADFLNLSPDEAASVELRLALSEALRDFFSKPKGLAQTPKRKEAKARKPIQCHLAPAHKTEIRNALSCYNRSLFW